MHFLGEVRYLCVLYYVQDNTYSLLNLFMFLRFTTQLSLSLLIALFSNAQSSGPPQLEGINPLMDEWDFRHCLEITKRVPPEIRFQNRA